ncbi:MAG TPA: hypothetical protein VEC37_04125 [Bacillota bacterium]|nr:hypothetical protein [Bacillota bacterium]
MKKFLVLLTICLLVFTAVTWADDDSVSLADEDLAKWKHPVKTVFSTNNINLLSVEIENKVNYSFMVEFPKELKLENEAYFDKVVKAVAKEVKYNDFKIFDDDKEISIEASCEKGALTAVVYNENPDFFKKLKALAEKEKQLVDLLFKKIPELNDLAKLVEKNSQGKAKMIVYISAEPDATANSVYEKEYYSVAIDQVRGEDSKTLDEFVVHKDTNEILWNSGEKYISLDEWRKDMAKEPYWPELFKN